MNTEQMVSAAAAWMDTQKPGWERAINLGVFDIGHIEFCIIGQTFGQEMFGLMEDQAPLAFRRAFCSIHGDMPSDMNEDDDNWAEVERHWVDEIKARFPRFHPW